MRYYYAMLKFSILSAIAMNCCGCFTFIGIPAHGGGKRFTVEQQLVAASARAVAKDIDIAPLVGKKCSLYVISMGDEGGGNYIGGGWNIASAIRGNYVTSPATRTINEYAPGTTVNDAGGFISTTTGPSNNPTRSQVDNDGYSSDYSAQLQYAGVPSFASQTVLNPRDIQFLTAILSEALSLRGVIITSPQEAELDVYFTVDVFGTCKSTTEYYVTNWETLKAETALEVTAVDKQGRVVMSPRSSNYEASYVEQYFLWMGPFQKYSTVRRGEGLLVDFSDMDASSERSVSHSTTPFIRNQPLQPRVPATPPVVGQYYPPAHTIALPPPVPVGQPRSYELDGYEIIAPSAAPAIPLTRERR